MLPGNPCLPLKVPTKTTPGHGPKSKTFSFQCPARQRAALNSDSTASTVADMSNGHTVREIVQGNVQVILESDSINY